LRYHQKKDGLDAALETNVDLLFPSPQPLPIDPGPEWRDHAACNGVDPDVFFPPLVRDVSDTAQARAICADCPVTFDCLVYAINEGINVGVWGGMSYGSRKKKASELRRKFSGSGPVRQPSEPHAVFG
jgi:WhiB family redox-sensing transcriptional regulator